MAKWGVPTLICAVIVIGLLLRYGGSSHYLFSDFFNGITAWMKALTLSGQPGNNPSGGNLVKG